MYDRRLPGRTLTFGNSGALYRNSLIMYDRQTHTLWSHLLGAAVVGPLKGERLRMIASTFTDWRTWRREHPRTLALSPERSPYGSYRDAYAGYFGSGAAGVLPTIRRDDRLPPKTLVLGVLAPATKAYSLSDLQRLGTINDRLAGRPVAVRYERSSGSAAAYLLGGTHPERLPSTPIFWFAWVDFFPGAPLWEPPRPP